MASRKKPIKPTATASGEQLLDLPVVGVFRQTSKEEQVHSILREHDSGDFRRSASFFDELLTDDRIAGVFEQRVAGLMAAPLVFEPAKSNRKARKLAEVMGGSNRMTGRWGDIVGPDALGGLLQWGMAIGVGVAQIIWEKTPTEWWPRLRVWHPQFVRWDEMRRRFILQHSRGEIELPRPDDEPRGDSQWFVWCPYGVQYGWRRGLVRSLGKKYISRQWAERDWDRHNERQGMAILKAMVPSGAHADHKLQFYRQLANIGSEAAVLCPQGKDGAPGYDLQVVEFVARTFEAMEKRKGSVDVDIAVRVLGQNLTTEVKEGSFAASKTANLVRLDKAVADSEIGAAFRRQVLTWWAEWNYGYSELAPWPTYYVQPPDDDLGEANVLKTLGEAITVLKTAEPRVNQIAILEEAGVPLLDEAEAEAEMEAEADQTKLDEEAAAEGATAGEIVSVDPEPTPEELAEIQAQLSGGAP